MALLVILVGVIVIVLAATRPVILKLSEYELNRRSTLGDLARLDISRAKHAAAIESILRVDTALFLVLFVLLSVSQFNWFSGVLLSVGLVLFYQIIAGVGMVRRLAAWTYRFYEKYLLQFCEKFPRVASYLASLGTLGRSKIDPAVYSKQEFIEILQNSKNVFSKSESKLVESVLNFDSKLVVDIMTPRSMIDSISHQELLGPIILSELHKTGHSRFPVIDGDIDHVVGMLYVRDLLAIDGNKNSQKVSEAMDKSVCFIRQDQTLDQALAAFLKTKKLLFVVINEFRETVGLLSLEDVIESLLGQKINDEFEKHSDLREVARRNPRGNNSSKTARNVP